MARLAVLVPNIPVAEYRAKKSPRQILVRPVDSPARYILVGLSQCLIKRLQGVQNAAARSILRTPRSKHISPLLQNLHWLPINRRTLHKVAALCHTLLSGPGLQYLSDLTHVYTPARSLCTFSDTHVLSTPNVKLKSYGQRSFAYHDPTAWNSLPLALRHQQESDCFKRALKTHLFSLN